MEPFRPLSQPFHLDEWIDRDKIEHLQKLADARGVDLGEFIREALDEKIQRELGNVKLIHR
jgi:Ribbon-helix-helix protein, copG family